MRALAFPRLVWLSGLSSATCKKLMALDALSVNPLDVGVSTNDA